jgi:hypothetical protein
MEIIKYGRVPLTAVDGQQLSQALVSNLPQTAAQGGLVPANLPLQVSNGDVSAVGAVALAPSISTSQDLGNAITFTLDNSAGLAAVTFKMFDALGLLLQIGGVTATAAVYETSGLTTAFNSESIANPYTFTGFNISAQENSSSLMSKVKFYELSSTGPYKVSPLNLGAANRNSQFNSNLLTFQLSAGFTASGNRAVTYPVPAGEVITFVWFTGGQSNRLF